VYGIRHRAKTFFVVFITAAFKCNRKCIIIKTLFRKSGLKSANACCHSVHRTIILPVVLYGCETWSLTLREKRMLKVFENWVLRGVFGPKKDGVTGNGENYIMRSFMICTAYQPLCG
jgi:hypothetical protein